MSGPNARLILPLTKSGDSLRLVSLQRQDPVESQMCGVKNYGNPIPCSADRALIRNEHRADDNSLSTVPSLRTANRLIEDALGCSG